MVTIVAVAVRLLRLIEILGVSEFNLIRTRQSDWYAKNFVRFKGMENLTSLALARLPDRKDARNRASASILPSDRMAKLPQYRVLSCGMG